MEGFDSIHPLFTVQLINRREILLEKCLSYVKETIFCVWTLPFFYIAWDYLSSRVLKVREPIPSLWHNFIIYIGATLLYEGIFIFAYFILLWWSNKKKKYNGT
jgi:hypothetical protein